MYLLKLRRRDSTGAKLVCSLAIFCLAFVTVSYSISSAPPKGDRLSVNVGQLLQDVASNEEESRRTPKNYYEFVQKETTPDGTEKSVRIETPHGEIGRVISVNNKEPSLKRCRADSSSLRKLLKDPQARTDWLQEQKQETGRIKKLVEAVPAAFIFEYAGKQKGTGWIRITFRPNPRFQPQSYETSLLKGMQGTLWVDPASHRLAKIDGTLIKNVKFGWGFLATIHRGGHFIMQQSRIAGGTWRRTYLQVDFDGSKLLFGQLHVHLKERSWSFVRLPDHMTLNQSVGMLEQIPTVCRANMDRHAASQAFNR